MDETMLKRKKEIATKANELVIKIGDIATNIRRAKTIEASIRERGPKEGGVSFSGGYSFGMFFTADFFPQFIAEMERQKKILEEELNRLILVIQ